MRKDHGQRVILLNRKKLVIVEGEFGRVQLKVDNARGYFCVLDGVFLEEEINLPVFDGIVSMFYKRGEDGIGW